MVTPFLLNRLALLHLTLRPGLRPEYVQIIIPEPTGGYYKAAGVAASSGNMATRA
jgi:hypothetical protein